jgi:alkanesulfonate monooxygenase SsuD/methylene tetrahydromethanopterin reductase-like flavin-dependent oxidoreductase (luciferase family)
VNGSISLRLYPHNELGDPSAVVEAMREQARRGVEAGFDGVMTSEHHGGFGGYSPNPLQLAGWLLEAMPTGWAAACPMLLPLRPVGLVAEEVAWLAARFPGRVPLVGVAPGALPLDFEVTGADFDERHERFRGQLPRLVELLQGVELRSLEGDLALAERAADPITVLSTANSPGAARRAARAGAGVVYDGASPVERVGELSAAYDEADGTGPKVLIRRVWLGEPPTEAFDRQAAVYQSYSSSGEDHAFLCVEHAEQLVRLLREARKVAGATALNLRIHVPGVTPEMALEQIERLAPVVRTVGA